MQGLAIDTNDVLNVSCAYEFVEFVEISYPEQN